MIDQLRAFRAHKQGLLAPLTGTPEQILTQIGWCRTVGATSPYLALMARAGLTRPTIDQALADCTIHELPSARGCAYLLPKSDFSLGLACAKDPSAPIAPSAPERQLGITADEIEALMEAVLIALESGPRDPQQLRDELGERIRRFGDEGKKRGITTDLPGALGRLQNKGKIRRIPVNGRIDNERYTYTLWTDNPLQDFTLTREETFAQLARRYESWLGPITLAEFQWFSGLSARAAKGAFTLAGITDQGSDLWALPETWGEFQAFRAPAEKPIHLIGSIDPYFLHTKTSVSPSDANTKITGRSSLPPSTPEIPSPTSPPTRSSKAEISSASGTMTQNRKKFCSPTGRLKQLASGRPSMPCRPPSKRISVTSVSTVSTPPRVDRPCSKHSASR